MPGLEESVAAILRNYNPGDIGICELADQVQLTLPAPAWAESALLAGRTQSYAAGQSTALVALTVPTNERWFLSSFYVKVSGGDGNIDWVDCEPPEGYRDTAGVADFFRLVRLTTAGSEIYWPDNGGAQTLSQIQNPAESILMEPGTIIHVKMNGSGSTGGNLVSEWNMRRVKLIRAQAP